MLSCPILVWRISRLIESPDIIESFDNMFEPFDGELSVVHTCGRASTRNRIRNRNRNPNRTATVAATKPPGLA